MMACLGRLLLVAALIGYGASAPFAHTHAHAGDPDGRSARAGDPHCDHHHRHGAHLHPDGTAAKDAPEGPALADAHRHAAVALAAGAIEPGPLHPAAADAVTVARGAAAGAEPRGALATTAVADGPDPPPTGAAPARAPPFPS